MIEIDINRNLMIVGILAFVLVFVEVSFDWLIKSCFKVVKKVLRFYGFFYRMSEMKGRSVNFTCSYLIDVSSRRFDK
jgi:hypothetical protein